MDLRRFSQLLGGEMALIGYVQIIRAKQRFNEEPEILPYLEFVSLFKEWVKEWEWDWRRKDRHIQSDLTRMLSHIGFAWEREFARLSGPFQDEAKCEEAYRQWEKYQDAHDRVFYASPPPRHSNLDGYPLTGYKVIKRMEWLIH